MKNLANLKLENKMSSGDAVAEAFDDFMGAFEAFKSANDERIQELESRVGADVLTTEKVERISSAMDSQKAALDRLMRLIIKDESETELLNEISSQSDFTIANEALLTMGVKRDDWLTLSVGQIGASLDQIRSASMRFQFLPPIV